MRREFHVRFCEGLGVRFPRATRLMEQVHELALCSLEAFEEGAGCNLSIVFGACPDAKDRAIQLIRWTYYPARFELANDLISALMSVGMENDSDSSRWDRVISVAEMISATVGGVRVNPGERSHSPDQSPLDGPELHRRLEAFNDWVDHVQDPGASVFDPIHGIEV